MLRDLSNPAAGFSIFVNAKGETIELKSPLLCLEEQGASKLEAIETVLQVHLYHLYTAS